MKKNIINLLFFVFLFFALCLPLNSAIDMGKSSYSNKEVELISTMRKLFAQYLTWERIFVIETLTGAADASKAQARFVASQDGICALFRAYYGDYNGGQIANLFKQYDQLIADYAKTAKNNSGKTFVSANKIYDKAGEIANQLSMANMNWPRNEILSMLKGYSDSLVREIDLQSTNPGTIDVTVYDTTFEQAMEMADTYAVGTIKQYPARFW